ncbi:MAG: glycosyltransferase family 9 protein [bacterium]|nr:glycosyltransferase family 9 protein [bacterium]
MENAPARILIIDTAWLGDVIFSTSLIGAAHGVWPRAELHVLVAPRGEAILRGHPLIHRLWVYYKHGSQKSARSLWKLGRELAKAKFDVVLNAHPSLRSRLLAWLTRAPVRVGYSGFLSALCHTHRVPNDLAVEPDHAARRLALLRALVPQAKSAPLCVAVQSDASAWAQQFLVDHAAGQRPVLALVIGSAWETKRWPVENYAALARRWITEKSGCVVVIGGKAEAALISRLCAQTSGAIPLVDEPIPHVAALLSRSTAVVGNDTGVSFLGIAAGAPKVVVLFGCTQVDYTFLLPHSAIQAGVPCCLPRTGHGAHCCRWGGVPWCMGQITVERVWSEISSS